MSKEQPPEDPASTASAPGSNHEQRTQVEGDAGSLAEDGWVLADGKQATPSSPKDGKKTKNENKKGRGKNKAGKGSPAPCGGFIFKVFRRNDPELTCSQCGDGLGFTRSQFEHPELAAELRCQE